MKEELKESSNDRKSACIKSPRSGIQALRYWRDREIEIERGLGLGGGEKKLNHLAKLLGPCECRTNPREPTAHRHRPPSSRPWILA
jgi:hypothetical protein